MRIEKIKTRVICKDLNHSHEFKKKREKQDDKQRIKELEARLKKEEIIIKNLKKHIKHAQTEEALQREAFLNLKNNICKKCLLHHKKNGRICS